MVDVRVSDLVKKSLYYVIKGRKIDEFYSIGWNIGYYDEDKKEYNILQIISNLNDKYGDLLLFDDSDIHEEVCRIKSMIPFGFEILGCWIVFYLDNEKYQTKEAIGNSIVEKIYKNINDDNSVSCRKLITTTVEISNDNLFQLDSLWLEKTYPVVSLTSYSKETEEMNKEVEEVRSFCDPDELMSHFERNKLLFHLKISVNLNVASR
eukprot:TRINITY_DN16215_c0_g1_i1.p1 TRINITY_DN16215_c0_g1~~TRINITY_DN16215_c0_g1_i1.p1  ORF type:complete len:207 (+),score=35.57 TRINITY_DN16215_c0_g1_i1:84-704(+)